MSILQIILDFIFPPSREELELREISFEKLIQTSEKPQSSEFPFIKSVFSYKEPLIRELIWQIKYKKNRHSLKLAGFALISLLANYDPINTLLVPIPISKSRRKERGFNQSELIIEEILKIDGRFETDFDLLIRVKNIDKQTFKNRAERIENSSKIFAVNDFDKSILHKKIIIIDDVTTTGSTIREARDALMTAGFRDVGGLTIAH